jgi:hypothetical protein
MPTRRPPSLTSTTNDPSRPPGSRGSATIGNTAASSLSNSMVRVNLKRARAARPGGRRRRGPRGCPHASHAVQRSVRVRTSVQLAPRVSRRPVSTRPVRSRCPDGQASGIRGLCASALSAPRRIRTASVRRDRPRWAHRVDVLLSTAGLGRGIARTGWGAALAAWPTRSLVQRQAAGRLAGSREGAATHKSPGGCVVRGGQVAGVTPDHGLDGSGDHAEWSLRWGWSPVVPRWRPYPAQRGSRLRPQRGSGISGALSARR